MVDKRFIYNFGCSLADVVDVSCKQGQVDFFASNMYVRSNAMFKWLNLPETIPADILELMIQSNGYVVITQVQDSEIHANKDKYKSGLYAFAHGVGLGGEPDVYYRPTRAIISSPAMGLSVERKIDEDCIVVRNDPLLMGLRPLFSHYATLMAENVITMRMYDINTRIPFIVSASDDNVAESARNYFDDIVSGKMGIVTDTPLTDEQGVQSAPYSGGAVDRMKGLIEYHQYLKAGWYNDIGINANFNMKREALNSSETGVNDCSLLPFVDKMYECRKNDIEKVNNLYGTSITLDYNSTWADEQEIEEQDDSEVEKEGDDNETV